MAPRDPNPEPPTRAGAGRPAPGPLEIEVESALTPREIQTRIRAGESLDEVALAAGVPLERVEPYAAPVIAEREFIAGLAQNHPVRRGGETMAHRTLRQVVTDRLASRRVDIDTVTWDAWKLEGRRWVIRVDYDSGKAHRDARFIYDQTGRFTVADNDDARWLLGLHSASQGPQPGRRRRGDEEAEPTVELNDELALVRVVQPRIDEAPDVDRTQPLDDASGGDTEDAWSEVELTEVDGVYDIVPGSGGIDVLYDMLASFDEDSVQIYAGLIRPPTEQSVASPVLDEGPAEPVLPPAEPERPVAEPEQPSLVDGGEPPREPPKGRKKRAQVPSWDEIMFGAPKQR